MCLNEVVYNHLTVRLSAWYWLVFELVRVELVGAFGGCAVDEHTAIWLSSLVGRGGR